MKLFSSAANATQLGANSIDVWNMGLFELEGPDLFVRETRRDFEFSALTTLEPSQRQISLHKQIGARCLSYLLGRAILLSLQALVSSIIMRTYSKRAATHSSELSLEVLLGLGAIWAIVA
jgi:hypothetical protein